MRVLGMAEGKGFEGARVGAFTIIEAGAREGFATGGVDEGGDVRGVGAALGFLLDVGA